MAGWAWAWALPTIMPPLPLLSPMRPCRWALMLPSLVCPCVGFPLSWRWTPYFLSQVLCPHKCWDLPNPIRCSFPTSYFLVLPPVPVKKFCFSTLSPSSLPQPLPDTQVLFVTDGLSPYPCYIHSHVSQFSPPLPGLPKPNRSSS